jgi:hypothetical protein
MYLLPIEAILLMRGVENCESVTLEAELLECLLALEVEAEGMHGSSPITTCSNKVREDNEQEEC